jgi:iron complex outermembrane receptor protein
VRIDGKDYSVTAPYVSAGESLYTMHGLSLKTDTGKAWDWSLNTSYLNQNKDVVRQSSGNFGTTAGNAATAGTITYGDETGWRNLDLRGEWRPSGDFKSEHQVSFGFHTDTYKLKTDQYTLGSGNWQFSDVGVLNTSSRGETSVDAIYVQEAWQIMPDLKLVLGAREEWWKASKGSNYANTNTVNYQDKALNKFSPKASLAFQASDDWMLKGSYGRAVRFPTVGELFKNVGITKIGGGTPTPAEIAGFAAPYNIALTNNPNLKPEIGDAWEFAVERLLQNGTWRTSIFGEEKSDALVSQSDITTLPGYSISSVQNVDKVRTYGIETALQASDMLINGLDITGSLAYLHTRIVKDAADPRLEGSQLPLIPVWRAAMQGTYHTSDKLSYSLGWRYSGRQHSGLINPSTQQYPDSNPSTYGGRSNFSVLMPKCYSNLQIVGQLLWE